MPDPTPENLTTMHVIMLFVFWKFLEHGVAFAWKKVFATEYITKTACDGCRAECTKARARETEDIRAFIRRVDSGMTQVKAVVLAVGIHTGVPSERLENLIVEKAANE